MTHHLVGTAEVASMLGVSRQRVHQLATEDPAFPKPTATLTAGAIWERAAIEAWAERSGRTLLDGRSLVRGPCTTDVTGQRETTTTTENR